MCGKVRAKKTWTATVSPEAAPAGESVTWRVMDNVPVIVFDGGQRFVVPMRWGFPDPKDWRRPRPIHARAETIDTTPAFAAAFRDGQRGIMLVESFNEAPESGAQHTVTTGPVGIAMLWRRFEAGAGTLLAAVMVTVPANALLARLPTDRMPALLAPEDWSAWLGEGDATPAAAKACLKTVENARWTMTPEERARTAKRARPTVCDPPGLF
jgi:putative SOS response-associated peptidase YedK